MARPLVYGCTIGVKVEKETRKDFYVAVKANNQSATEVLRDFIKEYIKKYKK